MTVSEPSRRERKKDETRRRIFDAAISLFREKGFEATTVDEITEKADVARGTFFNYFPRKEEIFGYMAEEHVARLAEVLPAMLDSEAPTLELLTRAMQLGADGYMTDKALARMVFAEWIKRDVSPAPDAEAHARGFMRDLLARGRARGEVRGDVTDLQVSAIFKGIFLATLFQWLYCEPGCPESITDLHAELSVRLAIVFAGIAPKQEVSS